MATISNIQTGEPQAFGVPAVQPQPARTVSPLVQQKSGDGITRVKDSKGRTIGVKPLTAIGMFDLTDALGDKASNAALFRQAMVAFAAVEIDGTPVAPPSSLMSIRALITRLGFHGFSAVAEALAIASADDVVNEESVKN
jgi:hypothetical protein